MRVGRGRWALRIAVVAGFATVVLFPSTAPATIQEQRERLPPPAEGCDDDIAGVVCGVDDVDQLVELLEDLFKDGYIARGGDGHAREPFGLAGGDNDAVEVEPTAGEYERDADQHAGLVIDQEADGMLLLISNNHD